MIKLILAIILFSYKVIHIFSPKLYIFNLKFRDLHSKNAVHAKLLGINILRLLTLQRKIFCVY